MESKIKMQFDPAIAREHGTDAAIIYSNIQYWVYKNAANEKNFHDGRYWTYNSVKAFNTIFDYLTEGQIRRCLDKLEKAGLIFVGEYNTHKYDRTKWYSCNLHLLKTTNGVAENDEPIPYNKPNKENTYIKKQSDLLELVNKHTKRKFRILPKGHKETLKKFTLEEIDTALNNLTKDKWHEERLKELSIDYLVRPTTIDKFLTAPVEDDWIKQALQNSGL